MAAASQTLTAPPLLPMAMLRQAMHSARMVQQQVPRGHRQQVVLGRVVGFTLQQALQEAPLLVLLLLVVLPVMAGWSMKWKCWQWYQVRECDGMRTNIVAACSRDCLQLVRHHDVSRWQP
jgi:hypothetical protein